MTTLPNATAADEQRFNEGVPDYDLRFEEAEFEADEEAEADRLEAEGRREIYMTLFGDGGEFY